MISIEARGRLGNHMFQFAFGLAAATRLGTDFAMNDGLLRPAFDLGSWNSPRRRAARAVRFHFAKRFAPPRPVKVDLDEDPDLVLAGLADRLTYVGFFQSERYFALVGSQVRAAFEPHRRHVEVFEERYADLAQLPYVCCHVRRTDYEESGWLLPLSYYHDCLRLVNASPNTPVVFVGDDLDDVEREFRSHTNVHFEHNDEVVDLQLLMNAAVVVTSNSSFGWWGSWLGAAGRRVYAPKHWLGFRTSRETPREVVPPGWNQVPVRD